MLPLSPTLSRTASRWAFQVSASLGATLIAALIVQELPRWAAEAPPPAPELTSGGKFAARVAAVRAYDGLDTMPLPQIEAPRVETPAPVPTAVLAAPMTDLVGLGAALRQPPLEAPAPRERAKSPKVARAPSRSEARRVIDPAETASATRDQTPSGRSGTGSDDGLLHQVASGTRQAWSVTTATTRDAWSATASAGTSIFSRLVP